MEQKHINIILIACIAFLSFICYQQNKTINRMEWEIISMEDSLSDQEDVIKDLESDIEDLKLEIASLQEAIENRTSYRPSPFIKRR